MSGNPLIDGLGTVGLTLASGGTAAPIMAGSGAGAGGLLGTAGAEAAGYMGSGAAMDGLLGAGAAAATEAAPVVADAAQWGDNIGNLANTIESSGLTPNAFTGGFDSLNGLQRVGQQLGGFLDDGGLNKISKLTQLGGQQPQARGVAAGGKPLQIDKSNSVTSPMYGSSQDMSDEDKQKLMYSLMMRG